MLCFAGAVVACISGLAIIDRELKKLPDSLAIDLIFSFSLAYYFCLGGIKL